MEPFNRCYQHAKCETQISPSQYNLNIESQVDQEVPYTRDLCNR